MDNNLRFLSAGNLLIILILVSLTCGCATSETRRYAKDFAIERSNVIRKDLGEITEHIIDMRESGYFVLNSEISSAAEALKTEIKANGSGALIVGLGPFAIGAPIHYKRVQSLARIWEPENTMREALLKSYKDLYDVNTLENICNKKRLLMYYWYYPDLQFSNHVQSWIYLDSSVLGKERIEEVTKEDLDGYFDKISRNNRWKVKLRYLGTAKYWIEGTINMFDLVEMNPA